jgi:hypothetical protein
MAQKSLPGIIASWSFVFGLCFSVLAGCAAAPKVRVDQGYDFSKKVTCAVLPFYYDHADKKQAAEMLRDVFTANLTEDDIKLIKSAVIGDVLREKGMLGQRYTPQELVKIGKWLNADIVVAGEVTKREKLYAVVHSNIRIASRIQVVDVAKGTVIFDIEKEEVRNAGLLRIPTGFVEAATSPIMGLDKYYEDKILCDLARSLVSPINIAFNPRSVGDARQPVIYDLSAAVVRNAVDGGRSVSVVLAGEEGCSASFSVDGMVKDVPLSYIGNGNFTGSYGMPVEMTAVPLKVTGVLVSPAGEKSVRAVDVTSSLPVVSDSPGAPE